MLLEISNLSSFKEAKSPKSESSTFVMNFSFLFLIILVGFNSISL